MGGLVALKRFIPSTYTKAEGIKVPFTTSCLYISHFDILFNMKLVTINFAKIILAL